MAACGPKTEKVHEVAYQGLHTRPQYLTQYAHIPFGERLTEKSGGRLNVTFYDRDAISKDVMAGVTSNLMQIGIGAQLFSPGVYPLSDVMCLPLIGPSATVGSLTTWHLHETFPEWRAEYSPEARMISYFVSATYQLHTRHKMVKTLEDLKGMKIIVISPMAVELMQRLGAVPISIGTADWYLSLERGMADAILVPLAPIKATKVCEVCPNHTIVNICFSPFYLAMNAKFYDDLPADLQKIVDDEAGATFAENCGIGLDKGAMMDGEWLKEQGDKFYVLPEAERARWLEAVMPMWDEWIADMEASGHSNVRDIVDEAVRYGDELVKQGVYVPDYTVFE